MNLNNNRAAVNKVMNSIGMEKIEEKEEYDMNRNRESGKVAK
jgi:hypothetical protein